MDVITSFFKNIKSKLSNPYFGTLTMVLLLNHWELVYAIFNFEKSVTLGVKMSFISGYLEDNITFKSFAVHAFTALLVMLFGYLIVVFTRVVVLTIEHGVMPWATGKVMNKNVVLRDVFEDVSRERDEYFEKYEEQRGFVRKYSKDLDEQRRQLAEKEQIVIGQNNSINQNQELIQKLTRDLGKKSTVAEELLQMDKKNKYKISELEVQLKNLNNSNGILELNNEDLRAYLLEFENMFHNIHGYSFFDRLNRLPLDILEKAQKLKENIREERFNNFSIRKSDWTKEEQKYLLNENLAKTDKLDNLVLTPMGRVIFGKANLLSKDLTARIQELREEL